MSKDRETRYFDFIHLHEERLNLIYRRWEAQIAKQNAANESQTLVSKIKSHKKTVVAGIAIAFGSAFLACQYGKVNASKTLIASNSQQLKRMTLKLERAAASQNQMTCVVRDGDIYQLTSGGLNHRVLANEPKSFISQANTISVTRHSVNTQQPDVYLRLNPNRNLLLGTIEQTNDTLQTKTQVIDLNRSASLPSDREALDNYVAIQENAIALYDGLSQCLSHHDTLGTFPPFPPFPYAD